MMLMSFALWVSVDEAKRLGCTHRARFCGIIPGFCTIGAEPLWVSRSDLLNWLEYIVVSVWVSIRLARGEDADYMFTVLGEK